MSSVAGRSSSEVSHSNPPSNPLNKSYMSSYEVSRIVQKCHKERDDAFRREESSRDKLKHLEISSRRQIQELKAKLKVVTNENKNLHQTVRKLRVDMGLEGNPRFKGKMAKDIIKELREQEDQCSQLKEDNQLLSVQLREMIPVIVTTQSQKSELQAQLEEMGSKTLKLTKENSQLSQLLQESRKEKEALERVHMMLKKSIEDSKKVTSRSVQTTTSIPVILPTAYKKVSRESTGLQTSQFTLEKRKVSSETRNSPPVSAGSRQLSSRALHNQS